VETLDSLLSAFQGWKGYALLFFMSLLENLIPPTPGDTFVMAGAVMVGRGMMPFLPVYALTTAGSILGFMIMYYAGRKWGRSLFQGRLSWLFSKRSLDTVEKWFARHGIWILTLNRFLGGFRAVVSLAAGIAGMNGKLVLILGLASCMLWNALILAAGKWIGENGVTVLKYYQQAAAVLISLVLAVILFRMILIRKLNKKAGG